MNVINVKHVRLYTFLYFLSLMIMEIKYIYARTLCDYKRTHNFKTSCMFVPADQHVIFVKITFKLKQKEVQKIKC